MTTGYEVRMYSDISRIADALEQQNEMLEQIRVELKRHRLAVETMSGIADAVYKEDRSNDARGL